MKNNFKSEDCHFTVLQIFSMSGLILHSSFWGYWQSFGEQCLTRNQRNKYEHFDKALGAGSHIRTHEAQARGYSGGVQCVLYSQLQIKSKKMFLVLGQIYGVRGRRGVSEAGLRLKESGKMVRLIKEENVCGARGDCKHLQPAVMEKAKKKNKYPSAQFCI